MIQFFQNIRTTAQLISITMMVMMLGCLNNDITFPTDSVTPTVSLSDFQAFQVGMAQNIEFQFDDTTTCSCDLTSSGSSSAGTMQVSNCIYSATATLNPCTDFEAMYTFTNSNGQYQVCDSMNVCDSYK